MGLMLAAANAIVPLVMAIPLPAGQASMPGAAGTDIVRTDDDRHERMTVPVRIGDHGMFRFLLDTGSQNTVLAASVALALDLPPGRSATVIGVAGSQRVATAEIDEIGLGRRSFYGLLAPLLQREHIGADGILGIDSLQDQRVLLDFPRNLIAVDDAKALGGNRGYDIVVSARRRSGQLIMTNAMIDGVRTDVVIDTGAQGTIGNLALKKALGKRMLREQSALYSVTGQQVMADIAVARRLAIGQLSLDNVVIAFTDAPPFAALDLNRRPALLLGMRELRVFQRVAIDFSTRKVLFDLTSGG
jgi:predicted aspartyl protease